MAKCCLIARLSGGAKRIFPRLPAVLAKTGAAVSLICISAYSRNGRNMECFSPCLAPPSPPT